MKKLWKKMSLGLLFTFILTIFSPYSALADEALVPSLNKDADGNYTITSVVDLNTLRSDIDKGINYFGQQIVLANDIEIGKDTALNSFKTNKSFDGIFDGKFHTISNYNDSKSGLFAIVDKDAVIKNIRIDANVVIEDAGSVISSEPWCVYYGLIANESFGVISQCSSTGTLQNIVSVDDIDIGGICGTNTDFTKHGEVKNCYSNVIFDNKATSSKPRRAGICADVDKGIEHCYFYGKFLGVAKESLDGNPIMLGGGSEDAVTCAYDKNVYQPSNQPQGNPVGYTTEEMKSKNSYTVLGFDFDKVWKIDPSVNNGYPYLNPENVDKIATRVTVDVQPIIENKAFDAKKPTDLKATVTEVKIVPKTENSELISKYNVKASYSGEASFSAPTIGDVPVNIDDISKFKITCDDTKGEYEFILGKVLPASGKILDDGTPGPTKEQQKQQIENAKKAEDILYKKLEIGQGAVPEFTWYGNKSPRPGEEGEIIFTTDTWGIFSAARSVYKGVREGYYDEWFKSVQDGLKKMKAAGVTVQDVKMTEWEKLVLAITAIGYDPRDIEAYDLIDIISNNDYKSVQYFAKQYANFALNSYNYAIPKDGNRIDLEAGIHGWAKDALGTTAADGSSIAVNAVPDMGTMNIQPIAAYYNPNAKEGDKYYDVKVAMEHVFDNFSNAQTYRGSFWGGYPDQYNNAWTNAQVYITLGMAHADIFDKKFVKNGKTILDGALEFYDIEKGTTKFEKENYEPAQMGRGLESLIRTYEGRNNIFDCTDVKDSTVLVNNAIKALPENITSDNKAEVAAAKALYEGLSDAKKASIKEEVKAKLTAAEEKVNQNPKPTLSIEITNLNADSKFKLGNDAKVAVKALNKSDKDQDAILVVALYDENNKFAGYACGKSNIKKDDSFVLTSMMKLPKEGSYKMKAFVCDGLENMNPISNIIDIPINLNK